MGTQSQYMIQFGQIFTVFFIMLGPLRIAEPVARFATGMNKEDRWTFSVKSGLFALLALVISGFVGSFFMKKWSISPATLLLTVGILFLLSAIHPFLRQREEKAPVNVTGDPVDVAMRFLISPHGLAVVVVLFSMSQGTKRLFTILGALVLVLLCDILFLALKRENSKPSLFTQILKSLLGTLQFALSLQIIYLGLKNLGVL